MAMISITEANLIKALGDFISSLVTCEVVRGQVNRVSSPAGDYIVMTPLSSVPLATNVETYSDVPGAGALLMQASKQWMAQIDCYGALANDNAATVSTALRSDYACQMFAATGLEIQPLYAADAKQLPFITGEDQYVERWTFEAVLQYKPVITVPQAFADALVVGLIDVDVKFPP